MGPLLIFDSHPVQYRVPVWREIAKILSGNVSVAYATDGSTKGAYDTGFGLNITWDDPMLEGYKYIMLNCENGVAFSSWKSLTGKGVYEALNEVSPRVVMITGLNYLYDWVVYWQAIRLGIPVWLRCETQDQAFKRPLWKKIIRYIYYRIAYFKIDHFFYIGQLNKRHYLAHGVPENKLSAALYCTIDRYAGMKDAEKAAIRDRVRAKEKIGSEKIIIGFSGKFIEKKRPDLLLEMVPYLPEELRSRLHFYFIGAGEMDGILRSKAGELLQKFNIETTFAGFVNQTQLHAHYLAMDIFVLPSQQMGETWGLVVNEALQAGCSVAISDAVGCGEDFGFLKQVKIFPTNDPQELAESIKALSFFPRSFDWAASFLENYSVKAAAEAISQAFITYK